MKTGARRGRPAQRGQALAEFLAVAVALVPLFLLIPVIAKYQDIAHSTSMASRYAAFDATIRNDSMNSWKSEADLAAEVRERFFGDANAAIKTHATGGDDGVEGNNFWRTPDNESLIAKPADDVRLSFGESGTGTTHGEAFRGSHDGQPFSFHNALGLKARGIYTANVSVALANAPKGLKFYEPFDQIDLSITRSASIGIDPWTGRNPQQVQGRLDNRMIAPLDLPSEVTELVSKVISLFEMPDDHGKPQIEGPKLGDLEFWTDVVPADRLRKPAK